MEAPSESADPPPGRISIAAFKLFSRRRSGSTIPGRFPGENRAAGKVAIVRSKTHDGLAEMVVLEAGGKQVPPVPKSLSFFSLLRRNGSENKVSRKGLGMLFGGLHWPRRDRPTRERGTERQEGVVIKEDTERQEGVAIKEDTERQEGVAIKEDTERQEGVAIKADTERQEGVAIKADTERQEGVAIKEDTERQEDVAIKADTEGVVIKEDTERQEGVAIKEDTDRQEGVAIKEDTERQEGVAIKEDTERQEGVAIKADTERQEGVAIKEDTERQEGVAIKEDTERQEGVAIKEDKEWEEGVEKEEEEEEEEGTFYYASHNVVKTQDEDIALPLEPQPLLPAASPNDGILFSEVTESWMGLEGDTMKTQEMPLSALATATPCNTSTISQETLELPIPLEPSVDHLCSLLTDVASLKSFDSLTGCGDITANAEEEGGAGRRGGVASTSAPILDPALPAQLPNHKAEGSGAVAYMGGGEEMASSDGVDEADMQGLWHIMLPMGGNSPAPLPPEKGMLPAKQACLPLSVDAPPKGDEGYWDSPTSGLECTSPLLGDMLYSGNALFDLNFDPEASQQDLRSKLSSSPQMSSDSSSTSFHSLKSSTSLPRDSKIPVSVKLAAPPHSASQGAVSSTLAKAEPQRTKIPVSQVLVRRGKSTDTRHNHSRR